MKQYFFTCAIFSMIMVSCTEYGDYCETCPQPEEELTVNLTFKAADYVSSIREFFDNTPEPELWERKIYSLIIYAFNPNGNWVTTRRADLNELTTGKMSISIPAQLIGKQTTFYVVVNNNASRDQPSQSFMDSCLDTHISNYNGRDDEDYSFALKYREGYTMSAKKTIVVPPSGESATIHFDLKRAVAKIAIRVKLHPRFLERYPGYGFILENCRIENFTKYGYIMESEPEHTSSDLWFRSYNCNHNLSTEAGVDFLFYVGANGKLPEDALNKPYIEIRGQLVSPLGWKSFVWNRAYFNTINNCEIKRNGYYRIEFGVTGINGTESARNIETEVWSI